MKTLFFRKLTDENKKKLTEACNKIVDFIGTLGLEVWEQYFVIKTLFEAFPVEETRKMS